MSSTLWKRLEQNAAEHPDKAAFIFLHGDDWETVTFGQVLDLSNRLARGLQACGLSSGMRAALMIPPSIEFFGLAFALLKTGIIPVITDPAIGLQKVTECLKESEPEIFIGNTLTHALCFIYGWGRGTIRHNLTIARLLHFTNHMISNSSPKTQYTPVNHAAIIYTSGSTGLPKGVVYTHENFAAQLDLLVKTFNIQPDEVDLPAFPLYALIDALIGVTAVIPDIHFPVPSKIDAARTLLAIQEQGVTNIFASPIMLDRLATYGTKHAIKLPGLKRVITAGAPAPFQVQEKFWKLLSDDANLFGIYGATETLPISIIESREIFEDTRCKSVKGAGVCIGRPVNGATVRIIKICDKPILQWDKSIELPVDQIGEITVKGKAVTKEYISRRDANQHAKIDDCGEIVHRMGDVGYFDEQGRLWYCGRKSHRVVLGQETYFTETIEGIFNAHPLVYRTALVGVSGTPVLWVELEPDAKKVDRAKIKLELTGLSANHPQASKIKTFLFINKFPTDVRHNYKIIREKLTETAKPLVSI